MGKKIHLSINGIKERIQQLSNEVQLEEIKTNKTKRKRLYHQLASYKKALDQPQEYVIDPEIEEQKVRQQKQKRIDKKMSKKKQLVTDVKKSNRYKKRCLKCGSKQHLLQQCPTSQVNKVNRQAGGFCFKCGSKDHSHKQCSETQYKLADCFFCGKKGHIARDCPKNEKGIYIKGGSCFGCGSVRHILKDCPQRHKKQDSFYKNEQQF